MHCGELICNNSSACTSNLTPAKYFHWILKYCYFCYHIYLLRNMYIYIYVYYCILYTIVLYTYYI